MGMEDDLLALIDLIYEASFDSTLWPTALISLADTTGTAQVSPTSPTEGAGRRQAAEILGTQLQRSALQGMSAHATSRLFRVVIFGGG
jgi:hypothetical protein